MRNTSNHSFQFNDKRVNVILEKYNCIQNLDLFSRNKIKRDINSVIVNSWGMFPDEFVEQHILGSNKIIIAKINGRSIGLAVMSIKEVLKKKIHYIEFVLIDKEFQKNGLGALISFSVIREEIVKNLFLMLFGNSLEIFYITPNIRVLTFSSRLSSFAYPNPYLADKSGYIQDADDKTWVIALELLKKSDNPNRRLERNGLVLHKSYANMPWLIYNNDNAPWHSDDKINLFAKRYLGYHTGEDREFMVRLRINFLSLVKFLLRL